MMGMCGEEVDGGAGCQVPGAPGLLPSLILGGVLDSIQGPRNGLDG